MDQRDFCEESYVEAIFKNANQDPQSELKTINECLVRLFWLLILGKSQCELSLKLLSISRKLLSYVVELLRSLSLETLHELTVSFVSRHRWSF